MLSLVLGVLVGLAVGFFGAIPPGPINVSVLRNASLGRVGTAFSVAAGGALIDALICGGIGFGVGWLAALVTDRWVKLGLALLLVLTGLKVAVFDRPALPEELGGAPPAEAVAQPPGSGSIVHFMLGLAQGAANPALIVNWTVSIGFLVSHGLLATVPLATLGFAAGVGLGGFGWFALLIEIVLRTKDHPAFRGWLRHSTRVAGGLLGAFGLYFVGKSISGW